MSEHEVTESITALSLCKARCAELEAANAALLDLAQEYAELYMLMDRATKASPFSDAMVDATNGTITSVNGEYVYIKPERFRALPAATAELIALLDEADEQNAELKEEVGAVTETLAEANIANSTWVAENAALHRLLDETLRLQKVAEDIRTAEKERLHAEIQKLRAALPPPEALDAFSEALREWEVYADAGRGMEEGFSHDYLADAHDAEAGLFRKCREIFRSWAEKITALQMPEVKP